MGINIPETRPVRKASDLYEFGTIMYMKGFESAARQIKTEVTEEKEYVEGSFEEIKDSLFDEYMRQRLITDFFDELENYVSDDEIEKMRLELSQYDDAAVYAALSLPNELRERKFLEFEEKIENQHLDAAKLMKEHVAVSSKHGFGIGYHTSPREIRPTESGKWSIKGTEKDHRDGDRAMAYYSTKYRHLFKKKGPKYIYIVRTEPETHKTDGNWSRATELSIIMYVPFEDVFEYVEKTSREIIKENGTT